MPGPEWIMDPEDEVAWRQGLAAQAERERLRREREARDARP